MNVQFPANVWRIAPWVQYCVAASFVTTLFGIMQLWVVASFGYVATHYEICNPAFWGAQSLSLGNYAHPAYQCAAGFWSALFWIYALQFVAFWQLTKLKYYINGMFVSEDWPWTSLSEMWDDPMRAIAIMWTRTIRFYMDQSTTFCGLVVLGILIGYTYPYIQAMFIVSPEAVGAYLASSVSGYSNSQVPGSLAQLIYSRLF